MRLLSCLFPVLLPVLCQASSLNNLIFLKDMPDGGSEDQIVLYVTTEPYAWVGFDAFTGHQQGTLYSSGKIEFSHKVNYEDPNTPDWSASGTDRVGISIGFLRSDWTQSGDGWLGGWSSAPTPALYGPLLDPISPTKMQTSTPQVCGTGNLDIGDVTALLENELAFDQAVVVQQPETIPSGQSFSRNGRMAQAAYQTNVDLYYPSFYFYKGMSCDQSTTMNCDFKIADYRWERQTVKLRIQNVCPGTYYLHYSVGKFQAIYERSYDLFDGLSVRIKPGAVIGTERKKEPVEIGPDGVMKGADVELPMPSPPVNESFGAGLAYELIISEDQLRTEYNIDISTDPELARQYLPVLEPIDCGCNKSADSKGSPASPGSGGPAQGSVKFDVSLGRLASGDLAGYLSLHSAEVTSALLAPASLELVGSSVESWAEEVRAITVGGTLRQIRAPQTFVDIKETSSTSYEIRFYPADAGGVYDPQNPVVETPSGSAHTTWVIGPGAAAGSVGFARGGLSADTWEFRPVAGGGTELLRNGVSETRMYSFDSANNARVEESTTTDPVYGVVSHTRRVWQMENGWPVKKGDLQLDAGGNALRGLDDSEYWVGSRKVYSTSEFNSLTSSSRITNYEGGGVEEHSTTTATIGDLDGDQRDEWLTTISTNSPDHHDRLTHIIAYTAVFTHEGVDYKKEETRQARTPSSTSWDSPGKRVTTHWTFADGANEGKTAWEFNPDGSATHWTYGTDINGNRVTVQETGTPDDNENPTAILYGTRSTTTEDIQGRLVSSEEQDIATALVFSSESVLAYHPIHGTPTVIDRNGVVETREYSDCCGRLEKVTSQGLVRTILYDALNREAGEEVHTSATPAVFVSGQRNELDALGRVRKTYQRLANGTERLIATADYDLAGVLTGTWSLQDGTVAYSEAVNESGQWVKTSSRAESATGAGDALEEVTITSGNGLPLEFRRNGVLITKWSYGPADEGYSLTETKVGENDSESEYVRTVSNLLGEQLRVEYPFPQDAHAESDYDAGGRLIRQTDPDGVQTLFAYERDTEGEHRITALDMNQDGVINYGASGADADRITRTTTTYATRDDLTVRQTTTTQWLQDGDTPQVVSVDENTVDGTKSWRTRLGTQTTSSAVTIDEQSGLRTETVTLSDRTQSIRTSLGGRVQSEVREDASGTVVTSASYQYDDYGRTWKITDARGTTTFAYYSTDLLQTVTTPDPGTGALVTTYGYNNRGAVTSITYPDTKVTERLYWPDGALKHAWGARTYPEYRTYDRQGRLKTLSTWQAYNPASHSGTGAAVTTWNYHGQRGWLENKRYQDNKGPDYLYTAAGRLYTRTWARTVNGAALVATYGHNHAGELDSIDYSDTTPGVTHVYDRAGRLFTTTDAAGTLTRSYYPDSLQLADETYTSYNPLRDYLAGRSLIRTYDPRFRPQSLVTDGGYAVGYGFDSAGRLEQVNQGFHAATFGYENGTSAHNRTTVKRVGVERMRNERVYDAVGRIDLTRTIIGGSVGVLRDYTLNQASQRTDVELEDGRRWAYGYDDLGQVTSAQKRLADDTTPLPGYTFDFTFDDIGNRTQAGANGRTVSYTPDLLNRYTSRQVAGAVDVRGEAAADAAVSITTTTQGTPLSPTRTGKDFYRELSYTNTSAAVSDTATITGTRSGPPVQTGTEQRPLFLPQTPENFGYDDDGNLTDDGRWIYTWDAENRLIAMETKTDIATAFPGLKQKLEFAYDAQGRRIRKQVEAWDAALNSGAGGWATVTDLRFVYDGWNLLTELDALDANAVVRSYAWGLDLSGSLQGAGGVGGLLWANTTAHTFAASADGNGNIVAWVNTANLAFTGRADYGPFGEVVQQTGVAKELPFGFSSKYTDAESGMMSYGYRFYCPNTGRWLGRDPIGEPGGLNIYSILDNDPINHIDILGMAKAYIGCFTEDEKSQLKEAEAFALSEMNRLKTELSTTDLNAIFRNDLTVSEGFRRNAAWMSEQVSGYRKSAIAHVEQIIDELTQNAYEFRCGRTRKYDTAERCKEDRPPVDGDTQMYTELGSRIIVVCPRASFRGSQRALAAVITHELSHTRPGLESRHWGDLMAARRYDNLARWPWYAEFPQDLISDGVDTTVKNLHATVWGLKLQSGTSIGGN